MDLDEVLTFFSQAMNDILNPAPFIQGIWFGMLLVGFCWMVASLFRNELSGILRNRHREVKEEATLTTPERMKIINRAIADGLTDSVEDMIVEGKLTRAEGDEIYYRVANVLSIPDLVPRGRLVLKAKLLRHKLQRELKKDIQSRLALAIHKPRAKLPGTTQEVPPKINPMQSAMKVKT